MCACPSAHAGTQQSLTQPNCSVPTTTLWDTGSPLSRGRRRRVSVHTGISGKLEIYARSQSRVPLARERTAARVTAGWLPVRVGVALRARGGTGRELEELAEQAGCEHRDRIDAQHRRARRTGDLIGEPDQPLVAAAAKDLP